MKKQAKRRQIAQQRQRQKRQQRVGVVARERQSRLHRPGQLLSHVPQAVEEYGLGLLNSIDGMAGLRGALAEIAATRGDWAGIPMPMDGAPLIIEPTYPKAAELMAIGRADTAVSREADYTVVNQWYSVRRQREVVIFRDGTGKLDWGLHGAVHHGALELATLGASDAWGIEQEARAVQLLGSMLRHRQFKQYLLAGMFMERSPRSGVHYLFRKLRPTLAISDKRGGELRILCALCLHPIAYYEGSWAGGMCPTDDVVAHLALMRGDEHMLWRRANQHPPYRPEAGL